MKLKNNNYKITKKKVKLTCQIRDSNYEIEIISQKINKKIT